MKHRLRVELSLLLAVAVIVVVSLVLSERRGAPRDEPRSAISTVTAGDPELLPVATAVAPIELPHEPRSEIELGSAPGSAAPRRKQTKRAAVATGWVSGHVRYLDGSPARDVDVALVPASMLHDPRWRTLKSEIGQCRSDAQGEFRVECVAPGEYFVRATGSYGLLCVTEPFALWPEESRHDVDVVLARGSFVGGRIVVPPGGSCVGLSVSLAHDRFVWAPSFARQELGPDGRFDLGPVSPGSCELRLHLPPSTGNIPMPSGVSSVVVATLQLAQGEKLERDFEFPDFPGTIAIDVFVNGRPASNVAMGFWVEDRERRLVLHGASDANGQFGPSPAFPGAWRLKVGNVRAGWTYAYPEPLLVATASVTRARIDVTIAEGEVSFFDVESGAALAQRTIYVLATEGDGPISRRKTDAQGRARWTLATGDYRFRLEPFGVEIKTNYRGVPTSIDPAHTVPFRWTNKGPELSEARL